MNLQSITLSKESENALFMETNIEASNQPNQKINNNGHYVETEQQR